MKKTISMTAIVCAMALFSTVVTAHAFGGGSKPAAQPQASAPAGEIKELTIPLKLPSSKKVEHIPLFSEKHRQTPVAVVDGEPITLADFAAQLVAMHSGADESGTREKKNFSALLDRMITIKLVILEAANIGLDQTPSAKKQLGDFALKTMITQLIGRQLRNMEPDREKVEELYRRMALEAKLVSYKFQDEAEARALREQSRAGGDFAQLVRAMVESGKAKGGDAAEYIKLKDLLPNIAQAVVAMEIGAVSEVFKTEKEFMLFKLEDLRVYEDPEARSQAVEMALQAQAVKKKDEYIKALEQKYVTMHKEAEDSLDFIKIEKEKPGVKASEVFALLRADERPLATIRNNGETTVITVAEIAKEVEATFYHGTEQALVSSDTESKKTTIIHNKLLKIIGAIEAKSQGIDTSKEYLDTLEKFREKFLFEAFMSKAVLPNVKVSQEEAQEYYKKNIGTYSTPLMLKMKSLAFHEEKRAREALKKLKAGSDFKWVSANVPGLAAPDDAKMLNFGGSLLASTALPHELQKTVSKARQGDIFLYNDPDSLSYVLVVEAAFPPQAKPYADVQSEAATAVYGRKIKEALDAYGSKLKKAYKTEIYLVKAKK